MSAGRSSSRFSAGQERATDHPWTCFPGQAARDPRQDDDIATIESSNEVFNEVCRQATADLYMLMTRTSAWGALSLRGDSWYSTAFGRDGIITAMLLLWLDPSVAKGVLAFLAATQAKAFDAFADAQPGKILHETRNGEMARLGEVPFRLYYGTVDATPLYRHAGGHVFRPDRGHRDDHGDLAEYQGGSAMDRCVWRYGRRRLRRICAADGCRPRQSRLEGILRFDFSRRRRIGGRADRALRGAGLCVRGQDACREARASLGEYDLENKLRAEAQLLQQNFEAAFGARILAPMPWRSMEQESMPGPDIEFRPCAVYRDRRTGTAARVAETFLGRDSFSGWGIRTVASGEARFNPISYHNGSVWPHDNAMIALGFSRYGFPGSGQTLRRDLRGGGAPGVAPPAGIVLRLHPQTAPRADGLSRRLRAASLGVSGAFAFLGACLGMELRHEANSA